MALLFRIARLPDRANTHIFTFVVTRSVTRDIDRDVTSKEFSCGNQRWAITFSRSEKVLGVFLVWKSTSEYMRVYVDFAFTILNREHFSVNETFRGRQVKFTSGCPAQGSMNYIPVADLYARKFTDMNGEFQLELAMGYVRTIYDTEFHLNGNPNGALPSRGGTSQPTSPGKVATKLETTYFTFGGFDWNLALFPHGIRNELGEPSISRFESNEKNDRWINVGGYYALLGGSSSESRVSFYLNRCTGFDHQCRVQYSVILGDGGYRMDSGVVDDVSDSDGKSYGWHPRTRFIDLVYNGTVRVHLEMILANTLSEVITNIQPQTSSSSNPLSVIGEGITQCYDRDKHGWSIKTDTQSEMVRLHMVYKEIQNVPRNHLRYVAWTAYVLKYYDKHCEPIPLPGAPFTHYYAQDVSDEGIIMETDISVKQLREPNCPFISDNGQLRIQVEWEESYLLFQATYHKYDDVSRMQNQQMKREINALNTDNYNLERQLFHYQKNASGRNSRGTTYSDEYGLAECQGVDYEEERAYSADQNINRGNSHGAPNAMSSLVRRNKGTKKVRCNHT